MSKINLNIRLSKEEKFKIIKEQNRLSAGLPPPGKLIKAKKGGSYQRKVKFKQLTHE